MLNVVRHNLHEVLTRTKVPQVRFHDLRHSAVSLLLARGAHVKVVQELLEHSSAMMTLDVYSHAFPRLTEQAVRGLAGTLLASPRERDASPTPMSRWSLAQQHQVQQRN